MPTSAPQSAAMNAWPDAKPTIKPTAPKTISEIPIIRSPRRMIKVGLATVRFYQRIEFSTRPHVPFGGTREEKATSTENWRYRLKVVFQWTTR
jgi:hypothetical protein